MTTFSAREAAPLAHTLAQHLGREAGIRVLSIKGPVVAMHGLRPERVSADADVLVDPAEHSRFLELLSAAGWYERATTRAPKVLGEHSATWNHPHWPCDLDVHHFFPGFLVDEQSAFEELWADRFEMTIAARPVAAAGRRSSMLIGALHALRSRDARTARELDQIEAEIAFLDDHQARELLQLATVTGALEALRTPLARAGLQLPEPAEPSDDLRAWRLRTKPSHSRVTAWLYALRTSGWRERPGLIWRGIVPDERGFRAEYASVAPGWRALSLARLGRLRRGTMKLPDALRDLRSIR